MEPLPVTTNEQAEALRRRCVPALAVDLGFASSTKSCGISGKYGNMTFNQALGATSDWICNAADRECVLILEAPLSAAFEKGNPVARGEFERYHNNGDASDRRWHIGAGGAMSLAAIYFLRLLFERTKRSETTVHLVEGFASRYGTPKPTHSLVARMLHEAWQNGAVLVTLPDRPETTLFSVLGFFDPNRASQIPAVLRLPDGLTCQDAT